MIEVKNNSHILINTYTQVMWYRRPVYLVVVILSVIGYNVMTHKSKTPRFSDSIRLACFRNKELHKPALAAYYRIRGVDSGLSRLPFVSCKILVL